MTRCDLRTLRECCCEPGQCAVSPVITLNKREDRRRRDEAVSMSSFGIKITWMAIALLIGVFVIWSVPRAAEAYHQNQLIAQESHNG